MASAKGSRRHNPRSRGHKSQDGQNDKSRVRDGGNNLDTRRHPSQTQSRRDDCEAGDGMEASNAHGGDEEIGEQSAPKTPGELPNRADKGVPKAKVRSSKDERPPPRHEGDGQGKAPVLIRLRRTLQVGGDVELACIGGETLRTAEELNL